MSIEADDLTEPRSCRAGVDESLQVVEGRAALPAEIMFQIGFAPWLDLPLFGIVLGSFWYHVDRWARRGDVDTSVDLVRRLPVARIRLVALFIAMVVACWAVNLAYWFVIASLLIVGMIVAAISDAEHAATLIPWLVREWAFGFPQLILHPSTHRLPQRDALDEHLGARGSVVSPLRPSGYIQLDSQTVAAISASGTFVDQGTMVVVCGSRNGQLCVRPSEPVSDADRG